MSKGSFRDLFTMGEDRHLHRTILAYVNQMFQQISGIVALKRRRRHSVSGYMD